jgi:hypothetical protein
MRCHAPRSSPLAVPLVATSLVAAAALLAAACSGGEPEFDELWAATTSRVSTPTTTVIGADGNEIEFQRPWLMDAHGRYVHVYGVNVSGSHKSPLTETRPGGDTPPALYPLTTDPAVLARCRTEYPLPAECLPTREVSYVGQPFPLAEADRWFGQIAGLGFNSVRLITNWESVQPYRPGTCAGRGPRYSAECYDREYLDYYDQIIAKAKEHGLYVLVDMHQDIFSRHLFAYYNERPEETVPGIETDSIARTILALFPPYTDWVRGHGAGRWVVETCLPEKDLDSPWWGTFRALGGFKDERGLLKPEMIGALTSLFQKLFPDGGGAIPAWVNYALAHLPDHFEVHESSDFLPFTFWPTNGLLSLDAERCFAAFFAGDAVFPGMTYEGQPVEQYLQEQYIGAYLELVKRAKKYDHVFGYDLMNEPVGVFIMLTAAAAFAIDGAPGAVDAVLTGLLGDDLGGNVSKLVFGLGLLPPDTRPETLAQWGLDHVDLLQALSLNLNFDAAHLQPFWEKLGQAVQEEDPNAIVWFEPGGSIRMITGPTPQWDMPLTRPQGVKQLVFAPHWYPDIYPTLGLNSPPRDFNLDEQLYKDYTEPLRELKERGPTWLGNVPVVVGEFGTYFNFGGIEESKKNDYRISANFLNSEYEAFEELSLGRMVWCFAPDNDPEYGEWWNHEDFSIVGPDGAARGWPAYVRTHVRATSGKLVGERFTSQYHFWDPQKGERRPDAAYELTMESRETTAPTEVFVPRRYYPDGFYVWLSDGVAYHDPARQILYWYPTADEPGHDHTLRIEAVYADREALGWNYFFRGDAVVTGKGGVR